MPDVLDPTAAAAEVRRQVNEIAPLSEAELVAAFAMANKKYNFGDPRVESAKNTERRLSILLDYFKRKHGADFLGFEVSSVADSNLLSSVALADRRPRSVFVLGKSRTAAGNAASKLVVACRDADSAIYYAVESNYLVEWAADDIRNRPKRSGCLSVLVFATLILAGLAAAGSMIGSRPVF